MGKPIRLTAIIPCYNFEKYVEQAVDSVLNQIVNFGIELLIIDDNSTDNTFKIINEKYKDRENVKIHQSPKNQGVTKNLKDMMDKATGQYLFTMDADDYIVDMNYFQRAVDFLDTNPKYSLVCSGYKLLHNDGTMYPTEDDPAVWASNIEDLTLNDLLSINHVSFGRVFRNYKNLVKPWMNDGLHEDWTINAEILKNGPAKCDKCYTGIYRITKAGRITSLTEAQVHEKNRKTINAIKANLTLKTISIVDSFVHNEKVKTKLETCVKWLKADGHDTLLVSNTPVDKSIISDVKFFLYDSNNRLFQQKYDNVNTVDFWKSLSPNFEIHDVVSGVQKHGLSVLVNLFNALIYAKQQGYTHFQRFEVDDLFGEKSREWIKKVPTYCLSESKKGLIYYNYENGPPDISFHYFFCEIDYFLSKISRITCEEDYIKYLHDYYGNKEFKIVEVFIYDQLKKNGDRDILQKTGREMTADFSDTHWNTETSVSNFENTFHGCTTKLYTVRHWNTVAREFDKKEGYILLTYSYNDNPIKRVIEVEKNTGEKYSIDQDVSVAGAWVWHGLAADTKAISVYQDGKLLYTQLASDVISYSGFRN